MNFYKLTTEKLKELKTWAQVNSPKPLQPALSYALDWLAPELLGTGFRMLEISDLSVKAEIPARSSNFDFQNEIHQGLILNASLELSRVFLHKQMPESYFQIIASEVHLRKNLKWNNDLELILATDQSSIDDFFIRLQKNKKSQIEFEMKVKIAGQKKSDLLNLNLSVEKTELLP